MARYAISDIHGCCKTFRFMVEEVLHLKPSDELFLLGDYINRGPDSKGVLDFIMQLQETGYRVQALRGNHEEMLLQAQGKPWLYHSNQDSLASFGLNSPLDLSQKYWNFLENLGCFIELNDYLLVHAGFDFKASDPFADTYAMLRIRKFEVNLNLIGNRIIVHGHVPQPADKLIQHIADPASQVLNIDGGCVYKDSYGLGHLIALNMDTRDFHVLANRD